MNVPSPLFPDLTETDPFPHTRFSRWVDGMLVSLGHLTAWIWLVLLIVIVANVTLRYLFAEGRIELEELQWHLYTLGFLTAISYAYSVDAHIRVDVLRERWSLVTRAWIELYGILLLLLPFVFLVLWASIPFVIYSFETGEISEAPGGLPYRFLIKLALPLGFVLLLLAVLARLSRVVAYLFLRDHG